MVGLSTGFFQWTRSGYVSCSVEHYKYYWINKHFSEPCPHKTDKTAKLIAPKELGEWNED